MQNRVLTSANFVHTPGIFSAMQNDYRVGEHDRETRRKAIHVMHKTYGISTEEAEAILSGDTAVTIDEAAGTVSYTYDAEGTCS